MSLDIQSEHHGRGRSPHAGSDSAFPSETTPSAALPSQPSTIPSRTISELTQNQAGVATDAPTLVADDFFPSSSNSEPDLHDPTGTSILETGSILDRNGRTYQGYREGKYFLPNDPAEQDRLDFQHAGITILLHDRLSWVPFTSPPTKVLDVATGTGIWAIEFAEQYPFVAVTGSDISRIQPANKPANCEFVQEDSEEPWIHPPNHFDYIHLRLVHSCFDHPKTVIRSAFDSLAPGGWIEFHDTCPRILCADGTAIQKTWDLLIEGAAVMGRDILVAPYYKQWLEEAGFVNVQEHKRPWPINGWPEQPRLRRAGMYMQRMLTDNARGIMWKMLQGKGLSPEEIEDLASQCKTEFQDTNIHGFWPFYVVYGQKPALAGSNHATEKLEAIAEDSPFEPWTGVNYRGTGLGYMKHGVSEKKENKIPRPRIPEQAYST